MIEFHGDIDELRELTKGIALAEPTLKKATVSALNKSITSTRAFIVREVSKEYNVTQKDVRKEINISRAKYSTLNPRLRASLYGSGSPGVPLFKFSPSPKRFPSTRRLKSGWYSPKIGIKVMIHRGSRKVVKGAFIAKMSSGHVGVFKRVGKGRGNWWNAFSGNQIKELYGPSPLRVIDSDRYYQKVDDFTQEVYDKNMAHEAEFYLKRAGILPNV